MIQLLGPATRDRTRRFKSIFSVLAGSAIRVIATFGVAAAALVPVGPTPALAVVSCPAGAITWATAVDGNWSDASKWTGGVPTSTDNACIPAGVTVTVDTFTATVNRLISEGTLDIAENQKLTIGGDSETAVLNLAGTIAGAGSLSIASSGTWTLGTMATSVEVATGATLDIPGSANRFVNGTLTNNGTVDQPGKNLWISISSGEITNNDRWLFTNPTTGFNTIRSNSTSTSGTFVNNGLMERRDGIGEVELPATVNIENHGTITASSGILKMTSVTAITNGAAMSAASGAALRMRPKASTGATVTGLSTISGTGVVEWFGGNQAVFDFAAGAVVEVQSGFELNGAEIAGPGTLSISGTGSWKKGTVSGNFEVAPTGTLSITGTDLLDIKLVTGSLVNNGTVVQPAPRLDTSTATVAGTITNNGLWQLNNSASNYFTIRGDLTKPGSFVNNDTLERTGASSPSQTILLTAGVELTNNGKVVTRSGQLWIGSASNTGTTLTGGTWEARDGGELVFPSAFTASNANLVLSGAGSSFGYLEPPFTVQPLDAFTSNTGTFQLAEGADFVTGADFTNTGTLVLGNGSVVGDASTLAVNGAFTTTGTVDIQVGGPSSSRLYGEVTATRTVNLGGTLRATLLNGPPAPGDTYQVMTYPAVGGTFGSLDILPYFDRTVTAGGVFLHGIDPAPIADAGGPYPTDEGSNVVLDGSASVDPGAGTIVSYDWQPAASFANNTNTMVKPTFTNTIDDGTFTVTLTVCDDATAGSRCTTDSTTVTVANVAPTVTAIPGPLTLDEGQAMALTQLATFSDPGINDTHTATIDWGDGNSEAAGTGSPVSGAHTYIQDGLYTITVTVTDDDGDSGAATIDVIVSNVSNVSPTVTITETSVTGTVGDTITVTGIYTDKGSADTHTADIDWGDGSSDLGVPVTGNAFSFDHVYTSEGTRTVRVCVADGYGGSGCDTVIVTIKPVVNTAPIVDAGGDRVTSEGTPVAITGTASDPDGDPFTTAWTSTPGGSFAAAGSLATTFTAAQDGSYTIKLTATDSPGGLSASDTATVTVSNVAPTIDSLRVDPGIPEGATASLDATFSDPGTLDTHTATIDWGEGDGAVPATATGYAVTGSNRYELAGTYTVKLCVTDSDGGTGCLSTTVNVTATPGGNTPPTSDPGGPYRSGEGVPLRLDGSGSFDPDGTIVSYRWTASGGSFDDPTSKTPMYTAPDDGVYELTLEVTDNDGLTDSATTTVTVRNADPRVEAGPDAKIRAGDKYRLKAKFDDRGKNDTHTATIDWGDGSDTTVIDPATSPIRLDHTYAEAGRYTVTVTVVDDDGGSGSDRLEVTVRGTDRDDDDRRKRRHDDDDNDDDDDDDGHERGRRDDDDHD